MERIQFYPNELLKKRLEDDAKNKGISTSALVVEALSKYYNLTPKRLLSLEETTKQVFTEIYDHIKDKKQNYEFDLLKASKTFRNIEMVANGKPSTNRAQIGKRFAQSLKTLFPNIKPVYIKPQKTKKSANNATIYQIVEVAENEEDDIYTWNEAIELLFPNCTNDDIEETLCDMIPE